MHNPIERRHFLGLAVLGAAGASIRLDALPLVRSASVSPSFPRQDAEMVQEMVTVAHSNLARVKQLVTAHRALANASIDWGFGDWEDALGAASHVGRVEIAAVLIAHGARPTIFSAAMLGQLETVKAFIAASPGCQRILGPHGITLLSHAKAGGERAKATREWLEQLGDADIAPKSVPLDEGSRPTYVGFYTFGAAADERLVIAAGGVSGLTIARPGRSARAIRFLGKHEFFPTGAEAVRIRFTVAGAEATTIAVFDPDLMVTATRQP